MNLAGARSLARFLMNNQIVVLLLLLLKSGGAEAQLKEQMQGFTAFAPISDFTCIHESGFRYILNPVYVGNGFTPYAVSNLLGAGRS